VSNEPPELVQAVVEDVTGTDWQTRIETIALTVGILAFGFMLGVHFYAATTMNQIPPATASSVGALQTLTETYDNAMRGGTVVAIVGIAGSILVGEFFIGENGESGE